MRLPMRALLDSFWRAAAYCLRPRVIVLSLLPVALMVVLALVLGYFFWESAVDAVRTTFEAWAILATLLGWLEGMGLAGLRSVLAPLVVVFLSTPVIVVLSLLLVAGFMTPAIVRLVAARRFPLLERRHGGSFAGSVFGGLWATFAALLALIVTIPLWLVPPLVLVLPPLIWGWLTYKVMIYDVLVEHASRDERRTLIRRHRSSLLAIGVVSGYLGAAPSVLWASGAVFIVMAPVLVPLAVWIYTLVFAFSALWFSHYALAALQALRREAEAGTGVAPPAAAVAEPLVARGDSAARPPPWDDAPTHPTWTSP
jgi:hypothetical protein